METASIYTDKVDFVGRFTLTDGSDNTKHYNINYLMGYRDFAYKTYELSKEIPLLKNMVTNLWKTHIYNQEYISFLLGNYSKEEFMSIAKTHAVPFEDDVDEKYILFALKYVPSLLDATLSSSDLSLLLNVDCTYVDKTLELLEYKPSDMLDEHK